MVNFPLVSVITMSMKFTVLERGENSHVRPMLEGGPVVVVGMWVRVMEPDTKAIVNESSEKVQGGVWAKDNVVAFVERYVEVGNGRGG